MGKGVSRENIRDLPRRSTWRSHRSELRGVGRRWRKRGKKRERRRKGGKSGSGNLEEEGRGAEEVNEGLDEVGEGGIEAD